MEWSPDVAKGTKRCGEEAIARNNQCRRLIGTGERYNFVIPLEGTEMTTQADSSSQSECVPTPESPPAQSWRKLPLLLIVVPPAVVVGVYLILQAYMKHLSSLDPTPNQGAMVVAFFVMVGTSILAAIVMLVGVILLLLPRGR